MNRTLSAMAAAALLATSAAAQADNQRGFFAGFGATALNADDSEGFNGADLWLGELLAGYKHSPWLGAELRYGAGIESDTVSLTSDDSVEADMELDSYQAAYYRAEAVNQTGRFYVLAGYADVDYSLEQAELSGDGFSWGLGFGFILTPQWNLNFEYKNILDADTQQFTTVNAALDYRF